MARSSVQLGQKLGKAAAERQVGWAKASDRAPRTLDFVL